MRSESRVFPVRVRLQRIRPGNGGRRPGGNADGRGEATAGRQRGGWAVRSSQPAYTSYSFERSTAIARPPRGLVAMRFHLIDRIESWEPGKSLVASKFLALGEEYL